MPKTKTNDERVRTIIADTLCCDETEVTPGSSLSEDLGADSVDFVEVMMNLEEEFGFEVSEAEAEKLTTVAAITEYVDAHAEAL